MLLLSRVLPAHWYCELKNRAVRVRFDEPQLPPCLSTTVELIASPNPIPPDFVVKNGSNMRSRSSTGIPGPESWTDSNTVE